MTRNVAKDYRPESPDDPTRFDLPPERYRLAIDGVHGEDARVSVTDPLAGRTTPVKIVSRTADEIVVDMEVTDSPRLLTIQDGHTAQAAVAAPTGARAAGVANRTRDRPGRARSDLRLQLRGARAVLRRRQLIVIGRCAARCRVNVRGTLKVGRKHFAMTPTPRAVYQRQGRSKAIVRLRIGSGAARFGRRAARRGSWPRIVVRARARLEGRVGMATRRLVLGAPVPRVHPARRLVGTQRASGGVRGTP